MSANTRSGEHFVLINELPPNSPVRKQRLNFVQWHPNARVIITKHSANSKLASC